MREPLVAAGASAFGFVVGFWRARKRRRQITVIEFTPDKEATGGQERAQARAPLNGGSSKDHYE